MKTELAICPVCRRALPLSATEKRKMRIKAAVAYQTRHKAAGLCIKCPRPAEGAQYCARHKRKAALAARKRLDRIKKLR